MTNERSLNFRQADEKLANIWSHKNFGGKKWTPRQVEQYRVDNKLTWHELNNMKTMQLVPTSVNGNWNHLGGVGEYNIFTNNVGDVFD